MNFMEEVYGHGQAACVLGQCFLRAALIKK